MDDPFSKLNERRVKREIERTTLNKRLAQLNREAEEDAITARVLHELYPDHPTRVEVSILQRVKERAAQNEVEKNSGPDTPPKTVRLSVKHMVLEILKTSYPIGLTAKQIRAKAYLRYRVNINSNTLTVTLVRYAKRPGNMVKCEHRQWFYIDPDGEIGKGKEDPGLVPGHLFGNA